MCTFYPNLMHSTSGVCLVLRSRVDEGERAHGNDYSEGAANGLALWHLWCHVIELPDAGSEIEAKPTGLKMSRPNIPCRL